ncbi:hypothetical protein [Bathymodiolus heckerae thiotrophic gill symbiont]|uniref:hypothetical protein n=1 Tax=Bathymodiolus heckerae thiotrophic gill symbiont TaxID=1052212 RepID=UPI0010FEDBBA|nr:hypothetical protein [Bathymodiolus heckerae thiotrophic gill symbiont]
MYNNDTEQQQTEEDKMKDITDMIENCKHLIKVFVKNGKNFIIKKYRLSTSKKIIYSDTGGSRDLAIPVRMVTKVEII